MYAPALLLLPLHLVQPVQGDIWFSVGSPCQLPKLCSCLVCEILTTPALQQHLFRKIHVRF